MLQVDELKTRTTTTTTTTTTTPKAPETNEVHNSDKRTRMMMNLLTIE
jgi:hypothetical protein